MTARALLLIVVMAGCGRKPTPVMNDPAPSSEIQLTTAPHGHILTNTAVWSPDSQWIVYDVRSDPAGSVFDGTRIERVNVRTKQIEVLYESKNGACVGVATVNPVDGRVVFIHGPEFPTPDWSYSPCHREGVIVDPKKPGVAIPLEARDIVPPFTPGALRGGTHVHTWNPDGTVVSFTYEDHVLTHGTTDGREPNRRTIGLALFPQNWSVRSKHERNRDGTYHSCLIAKTVANPKPGSDEIGRAFEDGWIPGTRSLTFIGEVVATDGRRVNELFIVDAESAFIPRFFEMGSKTSLPPVPDHVSQFRITHFADLPGQKGLSTSPRHWPRASPDGKRIIFLTENGRWSVIPVPDNQIHELHQMMKSMEKQDGAVPKKRAYVGQIDSSFTWHPNSRQFAAIADKSVCLIDTDTGDVKPLTTPSNPPPRPEACVVSPDGTMIAFVRPVNGFNQIFIVHVPAEAVK
jgi:hypothetical protein